MSDWLITVIPQPIDLTVYRPIGKAIARSVLGLQIGSPLVLVSSGFDQRKGHDLIEEILARAAAAVGRLAVVDIGSGHLLLGGELDIDYTTMGHVRDDITLALLYSAADVVLVPSRQDNLPQVATEALACGTPVVGFNVGGMTDAVVDRETGYLGQPMSPESLAAGVEWVLKDRERHGRLSDAASSRARRLWDDAVIARQYLDVYAEAIEAYRGTLAKRG